MLKKWASHISLRPWAVITAWIIVTILALVYGLGVFSKLQGGGFRDPASESYKVSQIVDTQFSKQQVALVALFKSSTLSVKDPEYQKEVAATVATIKQHEHITSVNTYYSTGSASLVSTDGHQTFATISLDGNTNDQTQVYKDLSSAAQPAQLSVSYGGGAAVNAQINDQINKDLAKAESLSFPILAVLLIFVFRSFIAAALPLIIGGLAILGAFLIVRILTNFTDISVYAINVITLLGLGLAIDYSLFVVSRFREELKLGKTVDDAMSTTMATAGRTIIFSGTTVILSLIGLLAFPQDFLRSMGFGGAASVLVAVLLALTILPAILQLLGKNINKYPVPFFGRHLHAVRPEKGAWYAFSHFVMRFAPIVLVATFALLIGLGLPFLHAKFTTADASSVPTSFSSRQVNDTINSDFPGGNTVPITVLVHTDADPLSQSALTATRAYTNEISHLSGVVRIETMETAIGTGGYAPDQAATQLGKVDSALRQNFISGNDELITVYQSYEPQSADAQTLIKNIRAISPPSGLHAQVGGESADLVDLLASLQAHLPVAISIVVVTTAILLFLMLGSVVVPIKAILLNILSLMAAFGVMVSIFQNGHLASFLHVTTNGSVDATQPVLIFAIAFGLAMDYELFLLSRIKEAYDQTGDNVHAVAEGVQKTGSIITSAALLLVIVIGLFATGKIGLIQQIGIGLGFAVAVDATIVRMLLVPAAMKLLGRANWWAPKPLKALSARLGLQD